MIIDKLNQFASAVALNTGGAGTYNIGDVIDLGVGRDLGGDQALYLVATVETAVTGAAGSKLAFALASGAADPIPTNGTQTQHVLSGDFDAAAGIAAGTLLFAVPLPVGADYRRYVGVQQITKAAAVTAGKVNVFLTPDVARWKAYDSPSQA